MELTIRELNHKDIDRIIEYWHSLSDSELLNFGADKTKFPKLNDWQQKLKNEIDKNVKQK